MGKKYLRKENEGKGTKGIKQRKEESEGLRFKTHFC
jgi:hypothetical protein